MLEGTLIVYKLMQFYCYNTLNNFIVKEDIQGKISLYSEIFIYGMKISHICPVLAQNKR